MMKNRFKKTCGLIFVIVLGLSLTAIPNGAGLFVAGAATKFTSVYTDSTKDCKGEEPAFTCKGYGGYKVIIGIGGVFSDARVEFAKSDYNLSIARRQSVAWNPKIEWRMADGKPFAVIVRVDVNDEAADIPKKTGEQLIIKGLKGFEEIDEVIDAKLPKANEKAREIADKAYAEKTTAKSAALQTDAAYIDGKSLLSYSIQNRELRIVNRVTV